MSDKEIDISRRKLLGGLGVIGGAGALGGSGTAALLWDEEVFGTEESPNILQAGELDLKVDWEEHYVDWIGAETEYDVIMLEDGVVPEGYVGLPTPQNPLIAVPQEDIDAFMDATITETSDEFDGPDDINASEEDAPHDLVDQPDPVVTLQDVKPGDFGEVTFSYHLFGNPGFVSLCAETVGDSDNGIVEPEDKVNGHDPDESDGTQGGDLGDHVQATAFYDPDCDNRFTGEEVEVMLATDVSESLDSDELDGTPPGVDGETGDASALEAVRAAIGDYDGPGFLSQLEEICPSGVQIGAVSFSENLEHLDNDNDGDDVGAGDDADNEDAVLDKALMNVGEVNRAFNPNAGTDNGGANDYEELKLLFGADQDFAEENEFVVDDNSDGDPFAPAERYSETIEGNDDYVLGNGNNTLVAERPYTGDGDSTQDDGLLKAIQGLLPAGESYEWTEPSGEGIPDGDINGIDPSGNASQPGEARKVIIYFTDGSFSGQGEDDDYPVDPEEAATNAENLGIEIKPVLVNGNPSQNDVEFAENLATSGQTPVFVTQYDGSPTECDSDVTDAGFSCTSMLSAMDSLRANICASAGSGTKIAGPGPINEVIGQLSECMVVDPALTGSAQSAEFGGVCHEPSSTGCIALAWWLPRDIPGVNDNIVQTDRYEFTVGFNAVQCRHNSTEDGEPIDMNLGDVDAEAMGD